MDKYNKKILLSFTLILSVFFLIIIYLTYFQLFEARKIANNPYNRRNRTDDEFVERGKIKDRSGLLLAYSKKISEQNIRIYPYENLYSHIIGYCSPKYGKSSIEASYNDVLSGTDKSDYFKDIRKILKRDKKGSDIVLTIDNNLQKLAMSKLKNIKGSVIVMDNMTGEIYAMASTPNFNPMEIDSSWEDIVNDPSGALLNRATQGLFEPGSVFKMVTAAALIENDTDLNYNDIGNFKIDGYTIKNFNKKVYGKVTLSEALINSINTYFSQKVQEIGVDKFRRTAEDFLISKDIDFDILTKTSSFSPEDSKIELSFEAIGQGKLLVSPLNILLITSAVAREGNIIKPHLIKEILTNDVVQKTTVPSILKNSCKKSTADSIKNSLYLTAMKGTAKKIKISGLKIGAKTGTAQTSRLNNAWIAAFVDEDDISFSLVIMNENTEKSGSDLALDARDIILYILNNYRKG